MARGVSRGGRYRPYGVQAASRGTSPAVPYQWTGREYDPETGFYFLRARYYDPTIGRFTQEDPIGEAGGSNLYAYVEGQPLEARDPSGLIPNQAGVDWRNEQHRFPGGGCDADICPQSPDDWWLTWRIAGSSPFGSLIDYVWAGQQACGMSPRQCQEAIYKMQKWWYSYGMEIQAQIEKEAGISFDTPGYAREVGGYCTASKCVAMSDGRALTVDLPTKVDGDDVLFYFHTHPDAGRPDPRPHFRGQVLGMVPSSYDGGFIFQTRMNRPGIAGGSIP